MILQKGIHKFKAVEPNLEYACVTAPGPTVVTIRRNGELEDLVYVEHTTHTWWSSNPMFTPPLAVGDEIEIEIVGPGAMRFECGGLS